MLAAALLRWPVTLAWLWLACGLFVCLLLWLERRAAGAEVDDQPGEKLAQRRWLGGRH